LDAPRQRRHKVTRTYARLIDEHGLRAMSYHVVRAHVADRRLEIRAETRRGFAL
jgi:hypothetical protein